MVKEIHMEEKKVSVGGEKQLVKCDRCLRIRDLFQYTHWVPSKVVESVRDHGAGSNPQFTVERTTVDESRGLCEPCAVIVNCHRYDTRLTAESEGNVKTTGDKS